MWGDVADLVELLDVDQRADGTYVTGTRPDEQRPVVEGSQMLAQAVVAAGRQAPGRRVVSAAMVFARVADAAVPLEIDVHELSSGRTFTALGVSVRQGDRECAAGTFLLDVTSADALRHAVAPPETAGPDGSAPYDMGVTGRDVRFVDGAYTSDSAAPVGPPVLDAWVRYRPVPDDRAVHAALLAHFTGHASIAAAFRPHEGIGQDQAHRTVSTAINAITISFHADVHADEWMLYHHHSTFAGDGMTHAECRVHDESGALLASFTVDAMVRPMATEHAVDERTSL